MSREKGVSVDAPKRAAPKKPSKSRQPSFLETQDDRSSGSNTESDEDRAARSEAEQELLKALQSVR